MSRQSPYLQRRGDTFSFRIAVPTELRPMVGGREFTKTLQTTDKQIAIPLALRLAATTKQVFNNLKKDMPDPERAKLLQLLREQKAKQPLMRKIEEKEEEITELKDRHWDRVKRIKLEAEKELSKLKAENEAFKLSLASFRASGRATPTSAVENVPEAIKIDSSLMLETVIGGFLNSYQQDKKQGMFRKHQTVLPMLLKIVGNKPINELKQADINGFFALLEKLPPRWLDECRKRKLTIKELAELEHPIMLGPKTIEDTYKACIRQFLKAAIRDWQDQGFPATLTTEAIEYKGKREEGENKQRAFTQKELERLFKGPEMAAFAANPEQAHYYWLPHIGLFTGARVNEICQLNPQTDILKDSETGIWYFWINEETEGDDRISKRTKNKVSRRNVPIHSTLKRLGFLTYLEQVKKQKSKLLFPAWKPMRGKASAEAEKWFRQFLKDTGLRDEKRGGRLVGMHAFRHTLLNRASNANPPINAESITGHAGEKTAIMRGYEGELSLENKSRILEAIPFGLNFE